MKTSQEMYSLLFNAITDVKKALFNEIEKLNAIQEQAEALYITDAESKE